MVSLSLSLSLSLSSMLTYIPRLDMTDAEIVAIAGIQPWQIVMYKTLAHYGTLRPHSLAIINRVCSQSGGAYLGDTNGNWGFGLAVESPQMYRSYGLADPFVCIPLFEITS